MSDPFIGEIKMVGFNFAPRGWAFCDGQLLSISQNSALFSLLGTFYGGDGRTTFAIPDLRGRVPVHNGTGPGLSPQVIGSKSGSETVQLSQAQLPAHTHPVTTQVSGHSGPGDSTSPNGALWAQSLEGDAVYHSNADTTMSSSAVDVTVGSTGAGQAITNMQPYAVVNFVIALVGIYPSRN